LPAFFGNGADLGVYQMPCDGTAHIETRIGLRSIQPGFGVDTKVGIMRVSSTLPGGTATDPLIDLSAFHAERGIEGGSTATQSFYVYAGCPVYIRWTGNVSAFSGDFLCVGVRAGNVGLWTATASSPGHVDASYFKVTVRQD
jgi:hypothetical protein